MILYNLGENRVLSPITGHINATRYLNKKGCPFYFLKTDQMKYDKYDGWY